MYEGSVTGDIMLQFTIGDVFIISLLQKDPIKYLN